jgi:acyl-CoA dehydrogenase
MDDLAPEHAPDQASQPSVVLAASRVGAETAASFADDVDASARFPKETFDALRAERLLAALIPVELGGLGAPLQDVAAACTELGRHCASSAMIYAMHQIQVACLVRHGRSEYLREFTRRVAAEQLLLASATTELGIGGDVRTSSCAVEVDGDRFRLRKQAPVISYGEHADAVLATARRTPDSPSNDQVLVVCERPDLDLERLSGWDTLGFRGTCSLGFTLTASGSLDHVLDDPNGDISAQTMLPTSHVLWTSLWLGIALAAYDKARRYVQAEARKKPGSTPPGALRLAELATVVQQLEESVRGMTRRYCAVAGTEAASAISFAVSMNALKVSASTLVVDIVGRAMLICGINGYRNDSPYSLGRLLRDAHGAAVMVNNDRINSNNAQLLLVSRS